MALVIPSQTKAPGLARVTRMQAGRSLIPLAMASLVLFAWVIAGILSSYNEILARDEARTPVFLPETDDVSAADVTAGASTLTPPAPEILHPEALFYSQYFHDSLGEHPIDASLLYLSPTSDNPPPPPGLTSWPRQEGAYLSPALDRTLKELGQSDRYGTVLGTIPRSALASPNEYFAYIFRSPEHIDLTELHPSSGFNSTEKSTFTSLQQLFTTKLTSTHGAMGTSEQLLPLWQTLLLASLLIGVPTIYLAGLSTTRNLNKHRRINVICATLGYRRRERARIFLRPLARALTGTIIGIAALTVLIPRSDIPLGFHALALSGTALRAAAPIAIALTVCFLALYTALYLHLRVKITPQTGGRLATTTSEYSAHRAGLAIVAIAVNAVSLLPVTQHLPDTLRGAAYLVSLIIFLLGVRDVIALAYSTVARRIRKRLTRKNTRGYAAANLLLLASNLEAGRAALLRFASALAAALVLSSQILTYQILFASSSEETASTFTDYHELGASAYPRLDANTERLLPLFHAIEERSNPNTLTFISTQDLMGEGECPAAIYTSSPEFFAIDSASTGANSNTNAHTSAAQRSAHLARYLGYMNLAAACVRDLAALHTPLDANTYPTVHSVSLDGRPFDHGAFQQAVHQQTSPAWRTTMPGLSWYVGQEIGHTQLLWAQLATGIGVAIVLLACANALLEASSARARRLAPINVLYGSQQVLRTSTNLYICVGLAVPALVGTAAGALLSYTLQGASSPGLGVTLAVTTQNVLLSGIALLACLVASHTATMRIVAHWKAGPHAAPTRPQNSR